MGLSLWDFFLALAIPLTTFILYELSLAKNKKINRNKIHNGQTSEEDNTKVRNATAMNVKKDDSDEESVEEFEVTRSLTPSSEGEVTVVEKGETTNPESTSPAPETTAAPGDTSQKPAVVASASDPIAAQNTAEGPLVDSDEESVEEFEVTSSAASSSAPAASKTRDSAEKTAEEHTREGDSKRSALFKPSSPVVVIAYGSNSRTAFSLANQLFNQLQMTLSNSPSAKDTTRDSNSTPSSSVVVPIVKVMEMNEDTITGFSTADLLDDQYYVLTIFITSTFTGGRAPPSSQSFETLLQDAYTDHRVSRSSLSQKRFALFGLGDTAYGEQDFNRFGKNLYLWCRGLGAPNFVIPPIYASDRKLEPLFKHFCHSLLTWLGRVQFLSDCTIVTQARVGKNRKKKNASESRESGEASTCGCQANDGGSEDDEEDPDGGDDELDDMEDVVWDGSDGEGDDPEHPPELLYPKLRQSLTKQGYQLIGTHSGVKLCRWTKSMLRGRGGCYKHTFYNINSSQCMEMTPSLACANKCIFCWRHHTNPVSRHFRWKQDPPELLVEHGMRLHYQMIKQMRGVPGVTPERLEDAMHIRHCALSLVGEPIMYPQINRFCELLHERHISSFMVTNAQFPDQLRDLDPVVQLYLSIDAATPEELKRIDRPLFEDYWERCLQCVKELSRKKQRTVFRLTLVNEYNASNIAAYADLVMQGQPDFIEVKGVTYCGTSTSSTLTMKENVPRHDEVIRFCTELCVELARRHPNYHTPHMTNSSRIPEEEKNRPYHIACEHEHSCCVLIALDKFFIDNEWYTWIDYEKFFELVQSGVKDFTSLDYAAPTPSWAVYRSPEAGFDPSHVRVTRTGKPRPTAPTAPA